MWLTAEDRKKFDERTDCEVKEYDGFEVARGQNLNGKLTLGENTADNGGIRNRVSGVAGGSGEGRTERRAWLCERRSDGYTPAQRFFIGFGQVWCENQREEAARMRAKTDPHSQRASGARTARCRTSTSSARRLAAK